MGKTNKLVSILSLIILILVGCNGSGEVNAIKSTEEFIKEVYTVDTKKIDNYNTLMEIDNSQSFAEAMQSNDKILRSLTTEDEYNTLISNRQNIMYTKECSYENYTMQVIDLTLSENVYDIKENKAGYNYEVKLKLISNKNKTEQKVKSNGYIGLLKEKGKWKVFVYKVYTMPKFIEK